MMMYIGLFFFLFITSNDGFDFETCRHALGIERGHYSNAAFQASSSRGKLPLATQVKIRSDVDGWCPTKKIAMNASEYIELDLGHLTVVTLIEIQGRFSIKPNEQYAEAFRLEYRREMNQTWISYRDFSGHQVLNGNTNSFIPTIRDLLPAIVARHIRLIPVTTTEGKEKYVCLRFELYGCSYGDGPVSYRVKQGDRHRSEGDFLDDTYDGQNINGILMNGLGQLTDGILAQDDEDDDSNGTIHTYDWIGWKKGNTSVHLTFNFPHQQNFSSIRFYTSNLFTRQIYLFQSIRIGSCETKGNPWIDQRIPPDTDDSSARWIEIFIEEQTPLITPCLNIQLEFSNRSEWILLSEIEFNSTVVLDQSITTNRSNLTKNRSTSRRYVLGFYLLTSFILTVTVVLIFFYFKSMPNTEPPSKLCNLSQHFQFNSDYQPISQRSSSPVSSDDNHTSYGISTCFTLNRDQSAVSTTYNPYLTTPCKILTPNPYASIDIDMGAQTSMKTLQGPCGNSTYQYLPSMVPNRDNSIVLPIIDETRLIIQEQYSTIDGMDGWIAHGYLYDDEGDDAIETWTPILIKILTSDNHIQKKRFDEENKLLYSLHHSHIIQFFGITSDYRYALIEHTHHNDLFTHLSTSTYFPTIQLRLYWLAQLSDALNYLECRNILHRDISARNCLLFSHYHLKLTHIAIASKEFQNHYFHVNGNRLPLRWMAPECFSSTLQFTHQTDIWAFGITLWEILIDCQILPYDGWSNEEIYHRLKSSEELYLPKPECATKDLIDLMFECWRPAEERPSFHEISIFFSKYLQQ